jgi:tRNA modification GTPase
LTPEGRGAVAVLLVAGANAFKIVAGLFVGHGSKPLRKHPPGRIVHGRWRSAEGEEIVVCRCTECTVEVHCHGGKAASERIVADLVAAGCREIGWAEWSANSEANPLRAAARRLLAEARTERAARILLDQYDGVLENKLQVAIDSLGGDHIAAAAEQLHELLARAAIGLHLATPWKVAIAGPPNVGKSSLLNALVGYQRAIVFDQPGTTLDAVTAAAAIDGWPIELIDTAGLRDAAEELEAAGIQRAMRQIESADLVIWVEQVGHPAAPPPEAMLHVLNKVDLVDAGGVAAPHDAILISTLTGQGIAELADAIVRRLTGEPPAPGAAVPFMTDQVAAIRTALRAARRSDASTAIAAIQEIIKRRDSDT